MFGYIRPNFTPSSTVLTHTKALEIVNEARRLGHDIYATPGKEKYILTIVSDDRVEEHEVTRQFIEREGPFK